MLRLQEMGVVETLYAELRKAPASEKRGAKSVEKVLGRRMEDFEKEWRAWALSLKG